MNTTVIIPNLNGMKYIGECLASLQSEEKGIPVIVVDNGSSDGSCEYIRAGHPYVKLLRFEKNTGFCKAVNAGIRTAETEYVLLLNNDTKADEHFVERLEKRISRYEKCFSVGAKMLSMDRPDTIDDAGDFYCALGWAFARGKGKKDGVRYDRPGKIFASCAGAAIYRKRAIEELGYFDEAHFAYLEDIDIAYRARIAGYFNYYEPRARVYHAGSAASGSQYNKFKVNFSSRNSVYIISKNMPLVQIALNLPFLAAGFLIKLLFFMRKGYGVLYIKGLLKGIKLSCSKKGREKRVKFHAAQLANCMKIQLELWGNMFRRICS